MAGAGLGFVLTRNYILLILAAIIGVISPADKDIGPFLSVEQSSLSHLLPNEKRTQAFAWYNLAGSFASALGALAGGWLADFSQLNGRTALEAAGRGEKIFGMARQHHRVERDAECVRRHDGALRFHVGCRLAVGEHDHHPGGIAARSRGVVGRSYP